MKFEGCLCIHTVSGHACRALIESVTQSVVELSRLPVFVQLIYKYSLAMGLKTPKNPHRDSIEHSSACANIGSPSWLGLL